MKTVDAKYIVLLCFFLLVTALSITKISDYDFWWHLKLGESVFNSGHIYTQDEFSYTAAGQRQFNSEWLGDLIIYLSFHLGGFVGTAVFKALVLLLTFVFLFLLLKNQAEDEESGFYSAIITLAVVLYAMRFRLFIRPYLFSFLFLSLEMYLLGRYEKTQRAGTLWVLPPVMLLWANTSKLAFYGPLVFLFFIIGHSMERQKRRTVAGVFLASLAVMMINPQTYKLLSFPFSVVAGSRINETVGEHQHLSLQLLWGYGLRYTFAYQVLAAGAMLYFLAFRGWRRPYHLLLFSFFFLQTLIMVRTIDFFALTAAALFVCPVERLLRRLLSFSGKYKILPAAVMSVLVVCLIPVSVLSRTYPFGTGIKKDEFPERAVAFLEKERIGGRMFNSYAFGGYLIWRTPDRKVFIDGRGIGALYRDEFYNAYFDMLKKPEAWDSADRLWHFDYAVLEYDMMGRRFPLHLTTNPNWALVYWDNHSAVYLKRTAANSAAIARYEYRVSRPNFYDFSYLNEFQSNDEIMAAITELRREIALNPANQEPLLAKVFLLYKLGPSRYGEMLQDLETAGSMKPDLAMKHSALALILLQYGQPGPAAEEALKALALDSSDPGAIYVGGKLGLKVKKQAEFHH